MIEFLIPMALLRNCREAARAASLAAHSAAGLASAAKFQLAARLLRSSEAMARAAVAALVDGNENRKEGDKFKASSAQSSSATVPGAQASSPVVAGKKKHRRRAGKNKGKDIPMYGAPMRLDVGDSAVLAISDGVSGVCISAPASAATPTEVVASPIDLPVRVLGPKSSRERSPRRPSPPRTATGATTGFFKVGDHIILIGLQSRPDLAGPATVCDYDSSAQRYGVKFDATGETIRVKDTNMKASNFRSSRN